MKIDSEREYQPFNRFKDEEYYDGYEEEMLSRWEARREEGLPTKPTEKFTPSKVFTEDLDETPICFLCGKAEVVKGENFCTKCLLLIRENEELGE